MEMAVFWSLGAAVELEKLKALGMQQQLFSLQSEASVELIGNEKKWFITGVQLAE